MASIRKYLYRKAGRAVTCMVAAAALAVAAQAQFRMAPPERKTPRAIGVLEVYKNGTRRIVPVSFFFEKKYYDAALYKAAPVPLALYSETVYEVQQYGTARGTFTVQTAGNHELAWWGNGKFKPLADPAALAKKKLVEKVVVEDPSKPTLHRREGSEGDVPRPETPSAAKSAEDADPNRPKLKRREDAPNAAKAEENDPDRPKLKRKEGSEGDAAAKGDASATSAPAAPASSAPDDPDRPRLKKPHSEETTTTTSIAPVTAAKPVALTPDADPDHPILRRGKPVQAQGGRDLEEFKLEEPVERLVAVSDAGPGTEPHPLLYHCPPEERAHLQKLARELAWAELKRVGAMRGLPAIAEPSPAARTAKGAKAAKPQPASSAWTPTEEQFVPYDLDWSNYATVVYSARYTPPQPERPAGMSPRSWVVTVVARQEEDKLLKLYSAVSDPRELDLYPEVRLVDAVDPDGYEHNVFLFRQKKRDGVSWLLARPSGYELIEVFETAVR